MSESNAPRRGMSDARTMAALRGVSTATLTTLMLKHGLRNVWLRGTRPLAPGQGRIAGRAFTLRFIPMREDLATPAAWSAPISTRTAVEAMPEGCVAVIASGGCSDAGVYGDILCARMRRRGVAGLVTDGVVRDLEGIVATGLPIWAQGVAAPPAVSGMTFVAWQEPIGCGGVAIYPDDVIVADGDGAIVVPKSLVDSLVQPAREQEELEAWILSEVLGGAALSGLYPPNAEAIARYRATGLSGPAVECSPDPTPEQPQGRSMPPPITVDTIEAAEMLAGVAYTPDERAQMLDNLEGQIASARARRAVPLANDMPAASRFDPRLPTTRLPEPGPLRFGGVDAPCPQDEADIAFAPLTHLSAWIANGRLTSRRLTEIYLRRIETLNPELFCFATVTPDLALAQADAADRQIAAGTHLGPLHGIPYGLKDLFDTAGIETGWGAEPFRDRVPERDAAIVTKLAAAGAVLLGKTTLGALAYGDIWYGGRTRNPWNLNEGSSGSSAGSASATAAGLCGFSIGTETLGSITSPSQRCGTTGLRPTFGRVSRAGGMALCWSLDKVGPICRAAEDTAMVLGVLNGFDAADRGSLDAPFAFDAATPIAGLRVGYLPAAFGDGATAVDHAALEAVRGLGLSVAEATLPDLPYAALMNVLYAEAAAAFEDVTLSDRDDTLTWQEPGAWPNTFRKARFLSAVDHVQLDRLRYQVMLALDGLFEQFDILIGPYATGPMLVASNFTGHPCLHLRAGFLDLATRGRASMVSGTLTTGDPAETGPRFRVPQGISLWGRLFDEARLVTLGIALERALGVAAERPSFAR